MKTLLIVMLAVVLPVATAQQPALPDGVTLWKGGIPPQGISEKDNYGDHILSVAREKSGFVEIHKNKADVMIIQSGTATLVVGGKGLNLHETAPNELQGSEIEGGVRIQ